jgi:Flp pilus assembly protein TadG
MAPLSTRKRLRRILRRFRGEQRGAAAVEFAIVITLLTVPVLNVVDLAQYAWDRMQVDNAAQMAVQAAWGTCKLASNLPATPNSYANCTGMPAAVTTAAQSTSLGTLVTVSATTEGYYCVNTSTSAIVAVGTFPGTKPANCSLVGLSSDVPGDYVLITTSYTYSPIFPAVSIATGLATPIVRQAWMRLG